MKGTEIEMTRGLFDISRRDMIRMLTTAGAVGLVAGFCGTVSPIGAAVSKPKPLPVQEDLKLPTDSNAEIRALTHSKVEIRFPNGKGYMRPGRNEFRDEDDLIKYLSQAFLFTTDERGGVNGTIKHISQYQRINSSGREVFTFGDPILDLITDDDGILILSGNKIDAQAIFLSDRSIAQSTDHSPQTQRIISPKIEKASLKSGAKEGLFEKVSMKMAQTMPPQEIFYPSSGASTRLHFRAFRTVISKYWQAGASIKTRNLDFASATITGHYALDPYSCQEIKADTDSDTTDNYLSELEWGIRSTPASGVLSECRAVWGGVNYSDFVAKGCLVS
jgi:hypothetical protein